MNNKYLLLFVLALASCTGGDDAQRHAERALAQARTHLMAKQFDAARDSILSIRRNYPTAIDVRKRGILLLDSIEMQAASDSALYAEGEELERLDMKAKFFERKLQEDKQK